MGKKTTKTKSTNEPARWAKPYLTGAAQTITDTVSNNQGNLDSLAGDIRGHLPRLGEMAFGNNHSLNMAAHYNNDVLGGKYLGQGNPYLNAMVQQGEQDAGNAVNSSFSLHGRTGGGNNIQRLAQGVAQAGNTLRYQDYGNERQAMGAAAALAPGISAARYQGVAPYLAAAQTAGQLPYAGISNLGQIGALVGNYGTQTQTQPGGWGTALLGALAGGASAALGNPAITSDRRLKTKIELLRRDPDGLGWYRYAYKWAPDDMQEGVMADEVKELRPQAYVPNFRGEYAGVNYAKLGVAA